MIKKITLLFTIVSVVALYFVYDLGQYLNFEYLKLNVMKSLWHLEEANKYLAGNWKKAHAPVGLLNWVEKFHGWRR